jgi:hypothetical protein
MTSSDGDDWVSTALIAKVDYDLRDADLAVTPDGRLMLLGGAAPRPRDGVSAPTGTFVCFSRDGVKWTEPQIVIEPGRWLWRTTWHEGKAYGFSYAAREGKGIDLLVSDDGIQWRPHARGLVTEGSPTEAQIRFDEDGRAIVLLRRDSGSAYLGLSAGDYTNWRWHDLDRSRQWGKPFEGGTAFGGFGGPNFAETLPGHWIAAGRMHEGGAHTALTYLDPEDQKMTKLLKLPSGGDTSYPGLVWHDGLLYVSYYSSHGGKTEIYLAKVQITERGARHNYVCRDGGAGGYEAFPDICRLVDDKLLCVFYAGLGHVTHPQANVPNGGRVMAATSTDEGRTWSQPWVVVDGPADDRDPSITRLKSGRLLCTYFTYPAGRVFMVHSDDQGVTWSAPRSIAPKSYYVSSPVRELSGTKSRLVLGLYRQDRGANGAVLLSDDEGQTWGAPIDIDNAGRVLDAETDVIELRDGSLYAAQRGASGTDMHWAVSRDRGQTWSKSESAGFQAHAPYLHHTVNGAIVLGHRRMVKGQLSRTAIRVSQDECKTWSEPFEADLGGGYSSMINLSDGSVLIVYYDDQGVGPKLAPGQHGQTVRRYSDIRARRFRVGTDGVKWLQPAGR